jgi:predicted amidohydrolase
MQAQTLRIALLHLAPIPGDLTRNRRLVETAVTTAARLGATWIITPELIVTGYTFSDSIGTEWILPQPDAWMTHMSRLAARLRVTLFLSYPEQDRRSRKLYNSLFAIGADGTIVGTHRKIHTLKVGSEAWSSSGTQGIAVPVPPFTRVGMLICADAYTSGIARTLQAQGAQLLVSSAAWAPGLHGPNGEWERCTSDTGLPLIVCNRTGPDRTLDFTKAETVVVKNGRRLLSLSSARSTVFVVEWDLETQTLATQDYQVVYL